MRMNIIIIYNIINDVINDFKESVDKGDDEVYDNNDYEDDNN